MKKRDYYILFLLVLLVAYATYYRSHKNEIAHGKKKFNSIQQSGIFSIKPALNYNDSISAKVSACKSEEKPST